MSAAEILAPWERELLQGSTLNARVALCREPSTEGWRQWTVTHPSIHGRWFYDTLPEAYAVAARMAEFYGHRPALEDKEPCS